MDDGKRSGDEEKGAGEEEDEQRGLAGSPWEWVAAVFSFVLVAGAIGYLVLQGTEDNVSAPAIVIEVDSIVTAGSGFLVEFHARNEGDRTASNVEIEGTLRAGGKGEESSSITIDYLPPGSERSAGLFFSSDPRTGALEIRPLGYRQP